MIRCVIVISIVGLTVAGCGQPTKMDTPASDQAATAVDLKLGENFVGPDVVFAVSEAVLFDGGRLYGFYFTIKNQSDTKMLTFQPFRLQEVSLTDEYGNSYASLRSREPPFSSLAKTNVRPGGETLDQLVFEQPVDKATKFTLTLDAANFGHGGKVHVKFTRDEYEALLAKRKELSVQKESPSDKPVEYVDVIGKGMSGIGRGKDWKLHQGMQIHWTRHILVDGFKLDYNSEKKAFVVAKDQLHEGEVAEWDLTTTGEFPDYVYSAKIRFPESADTERIRRQK